jgi:hypothetical protein
LDSRAQERARRGPVAALLILLGLLFGSGSGLAAGFDSGQGAQLGSQRHGAPAILLRSAHRDATPDDDKGPEPGASPVPRPSGVVTTLVAARPGSPFQAAADLRLPRAAAAAYRARAPPAA